MLLDLPSHVYTSTFSTASIFKVLQVVGGIAFAAFAEDRNLKESTVSNESELEKDNTFTRVCTLGGAY